jgi:hypothetical protein
MEYRGKTYRIAQGIEPNSWKWAVHLDEKTVKSGESPSREAARNSVVWFVDRALAVKKVKLKPPPE